MSRTTSFSKRMQSQWIRVSRHSPRAYWLLVQTFTLMALIRIALWVCPFALVHRFCTQKGDTQKGGMPQNAQEADPAITTSIVWAVRLIGTYLPKSTCLVEAYTLHFLLRQHNLYTEIHVGVKRQSANQITAHAWVEYNQQILLGELPNLDQYIPLYSIQRVAR